MIPALVLALICLVGALFASKKPIKWLMLLFSAIGSIATLIYFPELVAKGVGLDWRLLALVGAVGALVALVWGIKGKLAGAILTFAGIGAVAWAAFVVIPGGPAAFQYLGEGAAQLISKLWELITNFITMLKG